MKPAARTALAAGLAVVFASAGDCAAVSLSQDGTGQALIFPYYTVQSAQGNAFNTYISVVNHTDRAKALRMRFREGRNSREVMAVNVFLSPNDVWTAAVIPSGFAPTDVAKILSPDQSCVAPTMAIALGGLAFTNALYSGANDDGAGTGLDRTREGFVEIIEMGTLTGTWAAAVTHNSASLPANCGIVTGSTQPQLEPPTGGLSGTLTIINVNSGLDFGVSAEALADLAAQPFYRPVTDPYPSFNAAEINPVSVVAANGNLYRSTWARGIDAVSAALMRGEWEAEYALDAATQSLTDFIATFPTRQFYATQSTFAAPFTSPAAWASRCEVPGAKGEIMLSAVFNRETRQVDFTSCDFICSPIPPPDSLCASSNVFSPRNGAAHMPGGTASSVLGSTTGGLSSVAISVSPTSANGWLRMLANRGSMTSLATSTRQNIATGQTTTGSHVFAGLPIVGMWVRTFMNGTLACGTSACQGNYGGAFPFKYRRTITP